MDKIERVQNRAMRTILEKPRGTKSEPLEENWVGLNYHQEDSYKLELKPTRL